MRVWKSCFGNLTLHIEICDIEICDHWNMRYWKSEFLEVSDLGNFRIWNSHILEILEFGNLKFWKSQILEILDLGYLVFWISQILEISDFANLRFGIRKKKFNFNFGVEIQSTLKKHLKLLNDGHIKQGYFWSDRDQTTALFFCLSGFFDQIRTRLVED